MADNCDLPLVAVDNNPQNCDGNGNPLPAYGTQIVEALYQDSRGTWPALETEADLQAAMTAVGYDRLYALKNLAAGVVPASTDQTLTGNDVPFGATVITGRTRTVTARLQYPTTSTHAAVSRLTKHGLLRAAIVDNIGFMQGPIENVTINIGAFERPGLGQAIPANYPLTISYDSVDEPTISAAPLKFLFNAQNATTPITPGG